MSTLDIAGIVVHHRSRETLVPTILRLISEGLEPTKLLIVDNSEDTAGDNSLKEALPLGVKVIFTPNSGYGAAVNAGVAWHKQNTPSTAYTLVSTHEALPEPSSLQKLVAVLERHERAALVGPALVTGEDSDVIWSLGGYFSRPLGLPRHFGHKAPRTELARAAPRQVEWLDGAFLLFRRTVLEAHPIDEDFFLYMEETDHQLSLRRDNWEVRLEPAAVVWQSSGGTPAFYQTRNVQLFQAKNGSRLQALVSAPYIVASAVVRDFVRGRGASNWKPLLAGWKAGWQLRAGRPKNSVTLLINPLGGALAHYTEALTKTLQASGVVVRLHSIEEPSVSGQSRWRWLGDYLRLLVQAKKSSRAEHTRTLVVWPVLGFFDLVIVGLLSGSRATVVYHDPKPLVRAAGSDPLSARLVFRLPRLPHVVVHSEAAANAMKSLGFRSTMHLLAHPMFPPATPKRAVGDRATERPVVRVLGQFKRDRDLGALESLARELRSEVDLEIVGRGWPELEGWKVDARFVSEQELDDLVQSSDAIVIPYLRFYQSGIAIRALEANTPVVGRAATSLADLYGQESKLLVREHPQTGIVEAHAWAEAVRFAVADGREESIRAALAYHAAAVSQWKAWDCVPGSVNERS
ncbi:glycosyltransferase [Arthrobacter sp. Z1-9]